jgi:hypothetical protein
LPEGADPEKVNATYNNGVLEVEVDALALQSKAGRRVEIREGAGQAQPKRVEAGAKRADAGEGKPAH